MYGFDVLPALYMRCVSQSVLFLSGSARVQRVLFAHSSNCPEVPHRVRHLVRGRPLVAAPRTPEASIATDVGRRGAQNLHRCSMPTYVVTGASGGIGLATVTALAARGDKVFATVRKRESTATGVDNISKVQGDVTVRDRGQRRRRREALRGALRRHDRCDRTQRRRHCQPRRTGRTEGHGGICRRRRRAHGGEA